METPFNGRAILTDTFNELIITIPSKKNWFAIIFICVWLGGWLIGMTFALGMVFFSNNKGDNFPQLFTAIWLIGWTLGGFYAIKTLVWMIFGKEIITFSTGQFSINRSGALFEKTKTYDLNEAKDFRINATEDENGISFGGNTRRRTVFEPGVIHFDYGLKTLKFGIGIDEAEAKFLLAKLKAKGFLTQKHFA